MPSNEVLSDALQSIAQIRLQMARGEMFRGHRSVTTAATGAIAVVASALLSIFPPATAAVCVGWWLAAAGVALLLVGAEMFLHFRSGVSDLQQELTLRVVEHMTPSLVAGGLLTFVLCFFSPQCLWLLSGLWAMLFSLGIFSAWRLLPRGTRAIAGWYLLAGLAGLAWAAPEARFLSWHMGITFGVGQLLGAVVLYWNLERNHAST